MEYEMSSDTQNENKDEKERNASQKKRSTSPRFPSDRRNTARRRIPWGKFGKVVLSWFAIMLAVFLLYMTFRTDAENGIRGQLYDLSTVIE